VHLHCISVNTSVTGAGVISRSRAHKRDHHRQPRVAGKEKGAGEASVRAITRITRSRSPPPDSAGRGLTPRPSPRPQIHTRTRGRLPPPLTPTSRRWRRRRWQRRQRPHTHPIAKPLARLQAVSKGEVKSGDTWIEDLYGLHEGTQMHVSCGPYDIARLGCSRDGTGMPQSPR